MKGCYFIDQYKFLKRGNSFAVGCQPLCYYPETRAVIDWRSMGMLLTLYVARTKELISDQRSRAQSVTVGGHGNKSLRWLVTIMSVVRQQTEMNAVLSIFFPFRAVQDVRPWIGATHI